MTRDTPHTPKQTYTESHTQTHLTLSHIIRHNGVKMTLWLCDGREMPPSCGQKQELQVTLSNFIQYRQVKLNRPPSAPLKLDMFIPYDTL